jgi:16S rRNA (cytosine967-C5)-methyltransferase
VTRLRGRLDHLLGLHLHRPLTEVDPTLLEILRLGAYQLLCMGGVPVYAAVAQTVEQCRDVLGHAPTGLVNAVLRKVAASGAGPERFPSVGVDPAGFLASWGSHPRWLIERWLSRWGVEDVRRLVEANNARPAVNIVPLHLDPAAAAARLAESGIAAEPVSEGTRCVRLQSGSDAAEALAVLKAAVVQDPAANLASMYADIPRGCRLVDLCAAPGGKVLAVSDRPAYTLAADRSESRIGMVMENVRRAGRRIDCVVADARRPPLRSADVVLLDVPCSGTGTLARHPDARWRLEEASIHKLTTLQREMLEASALLLGAGGILSYSTCTLEPEENEGQIETFLTRHTDFRIEATDSVPSRYVDARGCLRVMPGAEGFDGAFAARMRKVA